MKKKNYRTIFLFGAAVLLLLGSVAGSSQAALTYYSENYSAQLKMDNIGVTRRHCQCPELHGERR